MFLVVTRDIQTSQVTISSGDFSVVHHTMIHIGIQSAILAPGTITTLVFIRPYRYVSYSQ